MVSMVLRAKREVTEEQLNGLAARHAASIGLKAPKIPAICDSAEYRQIMGTLDRLKHTDAFRVVKTLINKKIALVSEISSDGQSLSEDRIRELRYLFRPGETSSLAALGGAARTKQKAEADRKIFEETLLRAMSGTLSSEDVQKAERVFSKTVAAKMTIVCNDRRAASGKRELLEEDEKTFKLRTYIAERSRRRSEISAMLAFLKGLEERKFRSAGEFTKAFQALGAFASSWLGHMDWRDRPRLVQYAVGNNAKIENPVWEGECLDRDLDYWPNWHIACGKRYADELGDRSYELSLEMKRSRDPDDVERCPDDVER